VSPLLPASEATLPGGRRLRWSRLGEGPPLVLLHGYPDNLQLFARLARELAGRFTVFAFDWPGMGRSDPWPGGATPADMARRLGELLDRWGLERVVVAAHDMGGQPALAYAAGHPERVAALVVMGSLVFGDEETSWEIRLLRRFGWNRRLLIGLPRLVFRRAVATSLPRGERLPPELAADLWDAFRRPEVRRFVVRMCAAYQGSLAKLPALYPHIAAPTLVLWGERDRHFPAAHARRLAQAVPGARLRLLPGGEHWIAWHRAAEVAAAIAELAASR
jgi:pimeloyl-ACP methyl ester carboxylesterase